MSKPFLNLSNGAYDFAENWTYNSTQHEEFKNGICRPFCKNSWSGFATFWNQITKTVNVSNFPVCKIVNSSDMKNEWWLNRKMNSKAAYINSFCNLIPKCVKTVTWILAKWFANFFFEFLMLSLFKGPNFSKIGFTTATFSIQIRS